jgi:hypothetical protein
MRRPPAILAFLGCALLGAIPRLSASTTPDTGLSELCASADLICEVEVLDQECLDLGEGRIETRYTFATVLPMKGAMSSVQEVRIPGGAVGARGLFVPGMPRFETGERVILFLSEEGENGWRLPVALDRGAYSVQVDAEGATQVVAMASQCAGADCDQAGPMPPIQSHDDFVQRIFRELR